MTKETLGYVQLEWTCPNCGSKNPGPQKTCDGCGAPQPQDVAFEQPAHEALITDEQEIAQAKAGPDVHCAYCGGRNAAGAESCSQCGAALSEGTARASGRVMGAHRSRRAPDVPCPSCGSPNPANAHECSQCGATMARPKPASRSRAATPQKAGCGPVAKVAIAGVVLLAIVFFILTLRTKDVVGRVDSVSWQRVIAIEELGPATHEDWREDIPSDAVLGTCTEKVHHTQDDPAPNANKVCGTPYTVDSGSGYGEVVQDCQYEISADWCKYTVDEWKKVDQVILEGADLNPRWPGPQLAANQRQGEREENYKCTFDADGKVYTYKTNNAESFARCKTGSRWKLKVNTFNAVVDMEPTD